MRKRFLYIIILVAIIATPSGAQRADKGKLSPWLRKVVVPSCSIPSCSAPSCSATSCSAPSCLPQLGEVPNAQPTSPSWGRQEGAERTVIAFIKIASAPTSPSWEKQDGVNQAQPTSPSGGRQEGADQVLAENGCRSLAHFGNLHIASIPLSRLAPLTLDHRVLRIEASPTGHLLMDSMAIHLNATQAFVGLGLPQAFTGEGVVMGVMDVGFDLTHPNFYQRELATRSSLTNHPSPTANLYRIRRLWDQISQDTIGSLLPVGRDFVTTEELLALGHSRDGRDIAHGAHTLGIAAGSGYDSPYRGMAPDADICLVANAVSEDLPYIDPADIYKYTFATDALGFKYIFDYATSVGKPCVISFSEGSPQDFWGYDQLYYEFIDSLVGPGRILVAAAGNEGYKKNWMHKPQGQPSAGTFVYSTDSTMMVTLKSPDDFTLRLVAYGEQNDTLLVRPRQAFSQPDSTLQVSFAGINVLLEAYPSCYHADEGCYDLTLSAHGPLGIRTQLSLELLGTEADVDLWRVNGWLIGSQRNPLLADGETTHCIHSPSSAPNVISVGATTYRDHVFNIDGERKAYWPGTDGRLVEFSSTGPTMDGRIKPDCVAPGNNIISSYNSFYLEDHPDASDNQWDIARFSFQGRTYAWNTNSGTSMSTPAVGGAVALWLQACPTLSPADVLGLLQRTSRHPEPGLSYPNNLYGYGEVDVYAALLDLLGIDAISDIPREHTPARITVGHGQLSLVLPQAATAAQPLRLYDLSGRPVFSTTLEPGTDHFAVPLPQLSAGIYAVCVAGGSTLIRL